MSRIGRVRRLLRRVVKRARSSARVETCPYCELPMPVVGLHTEFAHCTTRECRDRHWWNEHFGVTEFPKAIVTDAEHTRTMRRLQR